MRRLIYLGLLAGCAPSEPCGTMTIEECDDAAYSAVNAEERARLAAYTCELGSSAGCSTLGLQLLLASESNDRRRLASYRAFRRSCESERSYLCTHPSLIELGRPNPDGDLVVNGFAAHCTRRQADACFFIEPAKRMLGMPYSPDAIAEAEAFDALTPEYSIEQTLSLRGLEGRQVLELPTLPADTPGNLWTYGRDGTR